MIDLGKHHLNRIDAIAAATKETDVDVLARALLELGPTPSAGALTGWLWDESIRCGLERRSDFRDKPEAVKAWQAVEAAADSWPSFSVAELLAGEGAP